MPDDLDDVGEFEAPTVHPDAPCKWFNDGSKPGYNCWGCRGGTISHHQCIHPDSKVGGTSTAGRICTEVMMKHYVRRRPDLKGWRCPFYEGDPTAEGKRPDAT